MKRKIFSKPMVFGIVIFLLMLIGQPTAFGYLHPADPVVLLAAMLLPTPAAIGAAGLAGLAADLIKGFYLLAPCTLVIRILMVLLIKKLTALSPEGKHEELLAAPAVLVPVIGYLFWEFLLELFTGNVSAAWAAAVSTLTKNLIQAAASVLIFIFLYDMVKGFSAARAQMRAQKEQQSERSEQDE